MKFRITARDWDRDLQDRFGEIESVHDLPDDLNTFIEEIAFPFGRFEVIVDTMDNIPVLDFQNTYD